MKFFLVVLAVIGAVVADDYTPNTLSEIKDIRDICTSYYPVTPSEIEAMQSGSYPDTPAVAGYLACVTEKMNLYSEEAGWNQERFVEQLEAILEKNQQKLIASVIEKCFTKRDGSEKNFDKLVYKDIMCLLTSDLGPEIASLTKALYAQ